MAQDRLLTNQDCIIVGLELEGVAQGRHSIAGWRANLLEDWAIADSV